MPKLMLLISICFFSTFAWALEINTEPNDVIDLSLINDESYDLSKPSFAVKPTLGRGLRDMQNSAGGSACTSCAH